MISDYKHKIKAKDQKAKDLHEQKIKQNKEKVIALGPEEPDKGSKVAEDKSSDQKVSKKSQDGGQPADNEELKVSQVDDQKEVKQDNLVKEE